MTRRKENNFLDKLKAVLPYVLVGGLTIGIVFVGSLDKQNADVNLSLDTFTTTEYDVSVDQISELYVVADLSNSLGLASASDVATNYVMASTMYDAGQNSTAGKLEKPNATNISASRGVVEHSVEEGETVESIAAEYEVTPDQIRWSNGLKTTEVSPGTTLYIPSTAGIVYTVKAGDTIDSIVEKYGSSKEEIIALNDLEVSGISEGARIVIKDGSLPEKERPEYVPPAPVRTYSSYTYTYLGDSATRTNLSCNVGLGGGQCTTWGWLKRPDLSFLQANANRWDDMARAAGIVVNHTPAPGAIFQTDAGWYGHVGYVESVNSDGSINISERNYAGCRGGVLFSTVPAGAVGGFNYIH